MPKRRRHHHPVRRESCGLTDSYIFFEQKHYSFFLTFTFIPKFYLDLYMCIMYFYEMIETKQFESVIEQIMIIQYTTRTALTTAHRPTSIEAKN